MLVDMMPLAMATHTTYVEIWDALLRCWDNLLEAYWGELSRWGI